ncbi:MAG: SH3 domain-containing protein [Chitinophagales bacterium]|nr:SH3 domain-containing protein [Chitinophagales bacterium]
MKKDTAVSCLFLKITLVLLVLSAGNLFAKTDPKALFEHANNAYKNNNYTLSIQLYDSLLNLGIANATLHYNLGNSYFKTNQIGKSILQYEKAHTFEPEDEDILYNLNLANSKIADHFVAVPELKIVSWWRSFTKTFSSTGWGIFAILFAWLALLCFALYLFTSYKGLGITLGIFLVLLSLGTYALRLKVSRCETEPNTAILLSPSVYVKSAPEQHSTDVFVIHEGVKLQVKDHVGSWYKIRLADGKVGWVEKNNLGFI